SSLRSLETELDLVTFTSGAVLMRQGDAADCLYLVINGRVRVVGQTQEGEQAIDTELGPGETVGEMGLLSGAPRTATVVAIRDTLAARLDRTGFDRFVNTHPQAALRMLA